MDVTRIKQVISYGWLHATEISNMIDNGEPSLIKGKLRIFFDIIRCYKKYSLWSNQYKKDKFYNLSDTERELKGSSYLEANKRKTVWTDYFYANKRFFSKWRGEEHDYSFKKATRRNEAYRKQYGLGENCVVRSNVLIMSTHGRIGKLLVGKGCMFGRNADIDYTGGLTLDDGVKITEECIVMTHNHEIISSESSRTVIETPLHIHDNVMLGARSTILPGVTVIGRRAMISAGTVLRNKIPPYAIVLGNPGKIVGFSMSPEEVIEFEKDKYPADQRTDIEQYKKAYNKYFVSRYKENRQYISN